MADRYVLWRLMAKELARRRGFEATFMPKPYADRTGNGAHFNMSLASLETGENLFDDPSDPRGCALSKLAYQFLAGVLAHARAVVATTCPSVNSYKRLVKTGSMTGYTWAPVFISYGRNNRTHMMRVPIVRPHLDGRATRAGAPLSSSRLECRAVDSSMNPYLGAAMMLAAGLEGIERDLDPGEPLDFNMYELSDQRLQELGVSLLPRTLLEAIEAFRDDPLGEQVMGEDLASSYAELKTSEWNDYHNSISTWELDTYLTRY